MYEASERVFRLRPIEFQIAPEQLPHIDVGRRVQRGHAWFALLRREIFQVQRKDLADPFAVILPGGFEPAMQDREQVLLL